MEAEEGERIGRAVLTPRCLTSTCLSFIIILFLQILPLKKLSKSELPNSLTNFLVVSPLSVRQSIPYISSSEIFSLRPDEFHGDVVVRPDRGRR